MPIMPEETSVEAALLFQSARPASWPYPMAFEYVRTLVYEGLRIGKTPWAADSYAEWDARAILSTFGDYPQETMTETCERRQKEH